MPDLSRVRTQRQIFGFRKCRQVCRPIDTRELVRAQLVNFKIYVIEQRPTQKSRLPGPNLIRFTRNVLCPISATLIRSRSNFNCFFFSCQKNFDEEFSIRIINFCIVLYKLLEMLCWLAYTPGTYLILAYVIKYMYANLLLSFRSDQDQYDQRSMTCVTITRGEGHIT